MGLTPFDVSNLNSAMRGVGDVFAQNRAEDLARQKLDVEEDFRQKMLDAEMRRLQTEQGRQDLLQQGTVDAWLQGGDEGGVVHFQGPQNGLNTLMQQSEAKGKPLTMMDQPPTAKPQYGVFRTSTPIGDLEFHLSSPDEVDTVAAMAKKMGGQARQPGQAGVAAPIQQDTYAAGLENQADQLDSQADDWEAGQNSGPGQYDPTVQANIARNRMQSSALRDRAKTVRIGRQFDPSQYETQTTTTPTNPLDPNAPKVTTTRRLPVGAVAPLIPGAAPIATAPAATTPGAAVLGPAQKAARANALRVLHPDWTRDQIISAVNGGS